MSTAKITPRVLKGFRDYLPQVMIPRKEMIRGLEDVFSSFGFSPIDTPALEYAEILLGKGSDEADKQLYRFLDNGKRDVALRFDLTVPLARFAAMHIEELGTPFKRYHIAPVWRAEKPQRGRYREFFQCDFDIIGSVSPHADAEIAAVIHYSLKAINIEHQIRLNNRRILNGVLETLGALEHSTAVLRAIDKLEKLGRDIVEQELAEHAGFKDADISKIFAFLELSAQDTAPEELFGNVAELVGNSEAGAQGIEELKTVLAALEAYDVPSQCYRVDLSIARGLDYYTGTIFETTCVELPEIGSICSGGRYDNLASLYTKKNLPGVGSSIGLDRIIGALETLERISQKTSTAKVLVTSIDEQHHLRVTNIAQTLRDAGFSVELYLESAKLGAQLKYANRKGIGLVVIAGDQELSQETCSIKDLGTGEQLDGIPLGKLVSRVAEHAGE